MNILKNLWYPIILLTQKGEKKKNKIGIEYIPGDTNAIKKPKEIEKVGV
jgi:hypothetical protein